MEFEKKEESVFVFPYQRGELLVKLNRISSLEKLKKSYQSLCQIVEDMEDFLKRKSPPRNPREDIDLVYNRQRLETFKKQKKHQEEKIILLENQIKQDIEDSKQ